MILLIILIGVFHEIIYFQFGVGFYEFGLCSL